MVAHVCCAALVTTSRACGERNTTNLHGCWLPPDGAHVAACRHRSSTASSTGSSRYLRTAEAVLITVHTSAEIGGTASLFMPASRLAKYRATFRRELAR